MAKVVSVELLRKTVQWVTEKFVRKDSAEMTKLGGIAIGAERNTVVQIKRNGSVLSADSARAVNIDVPVRTSQLQNDSGFQTQSQVQGLISAVTRMTKQVVTTLPQSGQDNVLYLVGPKGTSGNNIYEEFMWINNKFEKIGDTDTRVDLTPYLRKAELVYAVDGDVSDLLV